MLYVFCLYILSIYMHITLYVQVHGCSHVTTTYTKTCMYMYIYIYIYMYAYVCMHMVVYITYTSGSLATRAIF